MEIVSYNDRYKEQIINLILDIQNNEAKINLSLEEQPDLNDVKSHYLNDDSNFWVAIDNGEVIGTIGLMKIDKDWCVIKKFFVRKDHRSQRIGAALYEKLLEFAKSKGYHHIILDTPSVATKSHRFYERAGFRKISKTELPVDYNYPDRDSILYRLDMSPTFRF